jgi:hypothetical protein
MNTINYKVFKKLAQIYYPGPSKKKFFTPFHHSHVDCNGKFIQNIVS